MNETLSRLELNPFPPPGSDDAAWLEWANTWPANRAYGMECLQMTSGYARYRVERDPFITNPNGAVNGGIVAGMIDQALGVTVARVLEPGQMPRTGTIQVQYHLPARPPLTLAATILPGGRKVRFLEVHVEDADGQRCASGQGTMIAVTPRLSAD